MANEDQNQEQEAAPQKGKNNKLFVIIGIVAVLIIALGTPLVMMSMGGDKDAKHAEHDLVEHEEGMVPEGFDDEDEYDEDEEPLGALFPMRTFVVNLAEGQSYLRIQVQVEFEKRDVPRRFYAQLVPCRDALISLLTARTVDDLNSQKGKESLKDDIKDTLNLTMRREEVKQIYFTQFVIQ